MAEGELRGGDLPRPLERCYIGDDAAAQAARFVRSRCGGTCLLVADENTLAVGDELVRVLSDAGVHTVECIFPGEPFDATGERCDEVAAQARKAGVDAVVGLGSGTICDLAKGAADTVKVPSVLYATAPSMNGYTSAITALKVRGLKRTLPCTPALGVFANPAVVATAPQRMLAAGVGDFLSKCSASADWRTAHFLRGETFSSNAMTYYEGTVERVLEAAPGVGQREPEAVAVLLEALLLSGLSMLVAGSSSPASGGEHLISHYLDMKSALYGSPHDLHGIQVGVATVDCLRLWQRVLELDPADIDTQELVQRQPDEADIAAWIEADWGDIAPEVAAQWAKKRREPAQIAEELEHIRRDHAELCEQVRPDYLPPDTVATAIEAAGGPTRPEALTAPLAEYENARYRARYIRDRFTILDLAAELNLL